MIQGLNNSASGLLHQEQRLRASAHNTANTTTPEERAARLRVQGQEQSGGVVSLTEIGGISDAVRESVTQIDSAQAFSANVRAVQTQDEMLGTLLDLEA
ncbi:MAG: flagellar basal body rod protein FlgC [Candidatus Latescibacterota bacterium]|jgi:flagellar basal body rod protein FlgC